MDFRYKNLPYEVNENIRKVESLFKDMEVEYTNMIENATLEETKLLQLEFMECLQLMLSKCIIKKKFKLNR